MKQDKLIFTFIVLSILFEPTFAFGRSVGVLGFIFVMAAATLTFFMAAALWTLVFEHIFKTEWDGLDSWIYAIAVVPTAMALNFSFYNLANEEWQVTDKLAQHKIEYFCYHNFNAYTCVQMVRECTRCAANVDLWKREIAMKHLSFVASQMRGPAPQPAAKTGPVIAKSNGSP